MEIRAFQTDDQSAVVSLWQRCGLIVPWNDPNRDIERKLAMQADLFFVAVDAGRIIGTAMGGYDGHRGSLYYLAVDPDFRGQRMAARLVEQVEERLTAMGCPKLNIMVRSSNLKVIGFYEKLGYAMDDVVCMGNRLISDESV